MSLTEREQFVVGVIRRMLAMDLTVSRSEFGTGYAAGMRSGLEAARRLIENEEDKTAGPSA